MTPAWLLASLRRLRDERIATFGLVLLVLVTAFVFAVAPRILDAVADAALRGEISRAPAADRNVQLIEHDRVPVGDDGPLTNVDESGGRVADRIPASVAGLVAQRSLVIDSPRFALLKQTSDPSFVRFRIQPGVEGRLGFVSGRPPSDATRTIDNVGPDRANAVPVLEVALSTATADAWDVSIGDTVPLVTDSSDPLIGRGVPAIYVAFELVGIYEVPDEQADYWLGDGQLARPSVRTLGGDTRLLDAAALLAPEAYPVLLDATELGRLPLRYGWRFFVDPARLDSGTLGPLLADLRRFQAEFPTANVGADQRPALRTALLPLIERQQRRWVSVQAVLTVAAIGPAAVSIAALGLVVLLGAQRRRAALAIARSRGASGFQVWAAVVAEALLLGAPAVILAAAIAVVLVPAGPALPTIAAATLFAALTTLLLLGASAGASAGVGVGPAGGPRREGGFRRVGPRRLVAEGFVVAAAAAGAWLLRERGIRGGSSAGELATADPFIAAVPALAGLAAGLIAVRLYPLPIRLLAWMAAGRRGLVPILALRRAGNGGSAAPVLIVLLAAATIGAFSSAALVHFERAAEAVAWQEVGAPFRITSTSGPLPPDFEPAELPGVEASAGVFRATVAVGTRGPRFELLALDTAQLPAVVGGTPADPLLPTQINGSAGGPVPAIVSRSLTGRPDGVELGETFRSTLEGYPLDLAVVEVRDTFPGLPLTGNFVVVSRDQLRAAAPNARLAPTGALLRAPDSTGTQLHDAVSPLGVRLTLAGRAEQTAALRGSPMLDAVRIGVAVAAIIAGAYTALAMAAALALAGLGRAVEVAHLRTLGLSRREAFALIVAEHGPTVLVAFAAGLALGVGLFLLLQPGLGLTALIGSGLAVPLAIDPGQLAIVLAAIAAIVAIGMTLGAALQRGAVPATAVRRGFE